MNNEQILLLANTPAYIGFAIIVLEVIFIIGLLFGLAFLISRMISKQLINKIKNDKNIIQIDIKDQKSLVSSKTLGDSVTIKVPSVGDFEIEEELTKEGALEYIKETYNLDIENSAYFIIERAKEFKVKIDETHKQIHLLFIMCEFTCVEKQTIQMNVNAAGALMLYVDKEMRIFLNILYLLQKENKILVEEHQELIDVANYIKKQEAKILRMCLTIITECSNHD